MYHHDNVRTQFTVCLYVLRMDTPIDGKVCDKCGRLMNTSDKPHYVHGHLQCPCGRNIDECCQGDRANELDD